MTEATRFRDALHDLSDRLVVEYVGSLPPGRVIATVFRAHRTVSGLHPAADAHRLSLCETVARLALTERVARH